jgi:hypothetical protein
MTTVRSLSPFAYVAVVLALIIGVVAALLVGGSPSPPAAHAGELTINLPTTVWGLLYLSPLLVGFSVLLARRALGGSWKFSRRVLLQLAIAAAVALLFVFIFSQINSTNGTVSFTQTPATNNTTAPPGQNHSVPPQPRSNSTGYGSAPTLAIPGWALLAVAGGVTAFVAVLAVPGVLSVLLARRRSGPGGGSPSAADLAEAQYAVAEASDALGRGEDPRATIIRLYLRLLQRFGPRLGDLHHLTAEEIRILVLAPLRIQGSPAEALTRLFEEARYSTHPMGTEAADRCREALASVESDLARLTVAA